MQHLKEFSCNNEASATALFLNNETIKHDICCSWFKLGNYNDDGEEIKAVRRHPWTKGREEASPLYSLNNLVADLQRET